MVLFGTIINALLIIMGAFIGRFLHNIPERMKETVMYGIGLAVAVIGIQMTFESTQILIVIISIVIGAMAIIGAIDSGLRNDHDVLLMKGIIDGFTSIILSSTLGIGVAFAAVPVFLYQGIITLFSTQISRFVPDELLNFFI